MTANMAMPTNTKSVNKSSRNPTIGDLPITGIANSLLKSAPKASTIVRDKTINPQNARTCAIPGTVQANNFF